MDHRQLVYFVQHNRNYVAQRTVFYFLALCIERYINASVSEKS